MGDARSAGARRLVASIAGLFGGIGARAAAEALFDAFGFALPAGRLAVDPSTVVISLIVGVLVTLLASAGPAWKATRIAPLAALRETSVDRTSASVTRTVVGGVLLAGGVALVLAAVFTDASFGIGALGALATIVGFVVFGPVVARPASRVLGAPLPRLRGVTGSLARRNAMRNPRRTAGTATALMVGVGVVTLFTVFAASIKASIDDTVAGSVEGDLVISTGNFSGGGLSPQLATDIGQAARGRPRARYRHRCRARRRRQQAGRACSIRRTSTVRSTSTSSTAAITELAPDQIAVAKSVADDNDWDLGTSLPVTLRRRRDRGPDGRRDLRLAALVGDYVMPQATWAAHATQAVRPGGDRRARRRRLGRAGSRRGREGRRGATAIPTCRPRTSTSTTRRATSIQLLGLIYVLLALAIIIALMGIANTLSLSVYERTSELGLLRAVGTTRPQVRSMVRWESVIVAVFGTLSGIAVGVFLGWALFRLANVAGGFDTFAFPTTQLVVIVVVGAIAGVLAGLRPARRAAEARRAAGGRRDLTFTSHCARAPTRRPRRVGA